jgi:DNA-binding MarR family transcriptional regulator
MPQAKHAGTAALRKSSGPLRRERRAIDLGILNERLGYFIRRLQVWVFQDFIRHLAAVDISPAQFSVLVIVDTNRGLSQAQLSNTLGIERARLVRLLHHLEGRGLVRRLPSSTDGRRHELQLTKRGQTLLARAEVLAREHEAVLRRKLGRERHQSMLEALRDLYRPGSASLDDGMQPPLAEKSQGLALQIGSDV